jgi:hypothetical protein
MVILNHCIYIEEFEDTKEIIKIRISKNNIQRNGQKEKLQKDKQRSTKYAHQSKNRVTRTPSKPDHELGCSGRVGSSCFTGDTCCVNLVTNSVISHE